MEDQIKFHLFHDTECVGSLLVGEHLPAKKTAGAMRFLACQNFISALLLPLLFLPLPLSQNQMDENRADYASKLY